MPHGQASYHKDSFYVLRTGLTLVINKGEIAKIYVGAYDADKQYEEYKDAIEECFGK